MNRTIIAADPANEQRILVTIFPGGEVEVCTRRDHAFTWAPPLALTEEHHAAMTVEAQIASIAELRERTEQHWDEQRDAALPPYRPECDTVGWPDVAGEVRRG
jgi:hypothetical protein